MIQRPSPTVTQQPPNSERLAREAREARQAEKAARQAEETRRQAEATRIQAAAQQLERFPDDVCSATARLGKSNQTEVRLQACVGTHVTTDMIRGRICRTVILTGRTSLLRMWQAEGLFRRGARTLSQDLDRHFERLPLLVQRRYLQFDPCDRGD